MAKNAEQFESLLAGYVEGDLDARQRAAVERYLAANPEQRRLVQRMSELRSALRELPREVAPPDLREDVQGQLERGMLLGQAIDDEVAAAEMRIDRWSQLRAAAAIAVLVAGVAAAIYWALPEDRQRPDAVAIAPVDAPRIEDADNELRRRDGETLAGGMAGNRIDDATPAPSPATPAPSPAPTDPVAPEGIAETPPDSGNWGLAGRPGHNFFRDTNAAGFGSTGLAWLPLNLAEPSVPDRDAIDLARSDPLFPAASVLAESAAADMLVMIRTEDATVAASAVETYLGANGIAFTSLPPLQEYEAQQKARGVSAALLSSQPPQPPDEPTAPQRRPVATQPADDAPAPAPAAAAIESASLEVDDRLVEARRRLVDDQVLLARAVTRQQAVELSKSLALELSKSPAIEAERKSKTTSLPTIRIYGRGVVQQAPFVAQAQQAQLPPPQLDQQAPAQNGGSSRGRENADRTEQAAEDDRIRELAAGDVLIVSIPQADGSSVESRARIADDGSIELPTLGRVPAAGLTTTQLAELIAARLADQVQLGQARQAMLPTVRRVPVPAVPRFGWNPAARTRQAEANEKLDLLLVIRASNDPDAAPKAAPSSAPADAR